MFLEVWTYHQMAGFVRHKECQETGLYEKEIRNFHEFLHDMCEWRLFNI